MCGRFLLDSEIKELVARYRIENQGVSEHKTGDFYPSQDTLIILENEKRMITHGKWGFPYGDRIVINARAESIMNKPMFKNSFHRARCVIPANLFYEWKDEGNRKKVKHKVGLQDNSPILLGGIYKISLDKNLKEQLTFVIITTEADANIKTIHSRMPLIIKDHALDLWLNQNTSIKLIEKILKSNTDNTFIIERCEDESIRTINGNNYEQIGMF